MGIPLFFKKITSDFKDVIITSELSKEISRLFLDFNCAIHYCSNELKKQNKKISNHDFEHALIESCIQYIETLEKYTKPTHLIYISIDGVVPMAKITQQRKRRFLSDYKNTNNDVKEWNSNAITPGTNFMKKLVVALEQYSKRRNDIKIIVDNEKGEGEHKICHFIQNTDIINNTYDVIYGLDADLIILSMLSRNCDNILLLRENMKLNGSFIYMNIQSTKQQIVKQFSDMISNQESNDNQIIKSYVFITFMLGNDFLPHMSYINLRYMGVEKLLNAYAEVYIEQKEHIMTSTNEINLKFLTSFLEVLSKNEDFEFEQQERKYYETVAYNKKDIENYPLIEKYPNIIKSHKPGWRTNYYHYLFENNINSDIVSRVCSEYINGLLWMIDYYFNQTTNWYWFFKYDYSPTIVDLSNYVMSKTRLNNDTSYSYREIKPLDQLTMVLPPSNIYLIPSEKHKEIVQNISLGYTHNYPITFKICTFMKYKLHECGCVGICLNAPILI
jgi:5'-3' exonuclease